MASRQAVRICGGQGRSIRRLVGCKISWMRQGGFHPPHVQNAGRPAMFGNLAIVD